MTQAKFKDQFQPINHETPGIVLVGYATHQGALRNQGEPGAKDGPVEILEQLGDLYWHDPGLPVYLGPIISDNGLSLEEVQQALYQELDSLMTKGHHVIVLGGDHSLSWPVYRALEQHFPPENMGIVNFDAHFDFRDNDEANSGTSFYQIQQHRAMQGQQLNYSVVGIYRWTNSAILFEQAASHDIKVHEVFQLDEEAILSELEPWHLLYLSICMDVFSSVYAPGVSANDPIGLSPKEVIPLLERIVSTGKVVALSIAETAPLPSQEQTTAKLAARLIATYLQVIARTMK